MVSEAVAAGSVVGGFILFFLVIWFIMIIVGILSIIFWIFMLVDVAKRNFKKEPDKIVWILVVVLAGIIGALIYYFVIKRSNQH